jgi:RTX calcium-binding nonapeptide repeat (4 copies)
MSARRAVLATLCTSLFVVALVGVAPAGAALPNDGKRWRSPADTTGLTAAQVAEVCPRDGVTRCAGSIGARNLTGWIWASAAQVRDLMGHYEPAILTAEPPAVGGEAYFGSAMTFVEDLRSTLSVSGYGFFAAYTVGWTSSTDEAGLPIFGSASWGWWPPSGGFSLSAAADEPLYWRGVWLWRPATDDLTPPVITPTVTGTRGSNGWYVSDVSVTWTVHDPDSPVTSQVGCDPATVTSDTAGTTFTCQATSGGGTATVSTVVGRDTTPPTVTCPSPAPVFQLYQLGAWVTASVTDATSGRATAPAQGITNTNAPGMFTTAVTGADRAGHRTTVQCSYHVVVPTCNGLAPTRVGTAGNDVINGTTGDDVIVGLGGADTINGLAGDDVVCGGDGPDLVYGGDGKDWIDGGASPDDLNGGKGDDFLDGGLHNDSLRGDDGKDTCRSGEVRMSSCEL